MTRARSRAPGRRRFGGVRSPLCPTNPLLVVDAPLMVFTHHHLDAPLPVIPLQDHGLKGARMEGGAQQSGQGDHHLRPPPSLSCAPKAPDTSGLRCSSASGPCKGVTKPHTGLFRRSTSEGGGQGRGQEVEAAVGSATPRRQEHRCHIVRSCLVFDAWITCHHLQEALLSALAHFPKAL